MQIGHLAKRVGVNVQTVRFYEREGLLPNPQRTQSGYRVYGEDDLRRLQFIRQAKALGFSLEEIKGFLRMRSVGQCPCTDVIKIGERHLRDLERQIADLTKFSAGLRRAVRGWKKSGQQQIAGDAICTLIERTMKSSS